MTIVLLLGFSLMALIDLPWLLRDKKTWDIVFYSIFFILTFTLALLLLLDVKVPSPERFIQYVVRDLLNMRYE